MKAIIKILGIILIAFTIISTGCTNPNVDPNDKAPTGKPGELIFRIELSNDTLIINNNTIRADFIGENIVDEKLYAGRNSGSIWIVKVDEPEINISVRMPHLEDARYLFPPGNKTTYSIEIDTDFFFSDEPSLSHEDLPGEYRIDFEWGIFRAESKYFVVVDE
jgi:hypothetical protein